MDIIMEIHKIVLASISFNNLSKESFLSFTFNINVCIFLSKTICCKMSNKKWQDPCFVEPASQPGYQSVWRYWEEARPDQDVYSSLPAKWAIFLVDC